MLSKPSTPAVHTTLSLTHGVLQGTSLVETTTRLIVFLAVLALACNYIFSFTRTIVIQLEQGAPELTVPTIPERHEVEVITTAPALPSEVSYVKPLRDGMKQVVFTFDGGEGSQSANRILDVLAQHHIRGTFFLTGKFVKRNPELVKRIVDAGHEVFNHTYDHRHLPELSDAEIIAEFADMEQALASTTNRSSKPYFRAPYGDRDQHVLDVAYRAGYQSIYWSVDARDWMETSGETADSVRDRIFMNLAPGNIYLMHVGDYITGSILDDVFTKLEAQGYKIVSLTEAML